MMNWFGQRKTLHYRYASDIVEKITSLYSKSPNVIYLKFPETGRITVCGDLHGQYADLATIFKMNGMRIRHDDVIGLPSSNNWYIFNGDFVDRGKQGAEVIFLLYALKLLYPEFIHLNRGNHEQRHLNAK